MRPAAQRLAEFISQVPKIGLRQALTNAGLADVEKLKPDEIALAVADVLVTDASQLIMTELRDALATVVEELCENAQSLEQAEQKITESAGKLESVVQNLFECYIMERFKTFFCEHEAAKHGYEAADNILKEARVFISTEMDIQRADKHDLTGVDWSGQKARKSWTPYWNEPSRCTRARNCMKITVEQDGAEVFHELSLMKIQCEGIERAFRLDVDFSAVIDFSWNAQCSASTFWSFARAFTRWTKLCLGTQTPDLWTRTLDVTIPVRNREAWVRQVRPGGSRFISYG